MSREFRRLLVFLPFRDRIKVEVARLRCVRLLGEQNLDPLQSSLVLDLLKQQVERHGAEVLVVSPSDADPRLPSVVLADDDLRDAMLQAQPDDQFGHMVEVVLNSEVPLLEDSLGRRLCSIGHLLGQRFVVPLIDALQDATVDQYGTRHEARPGWTLLD